MKRILLTVLISLVFLATPALADNYKCLAELYPEQAEYIGCPKLGGYIEGTGEMGGQHRIIGECKDPRQDVWLQFIDTTVMGTGKLDGQCDAVMQIYLIDNKLHIGQMFTCEEIEASLIRFCEDYGIKMEDFIHRAEPQPIKSYMEI